MNLCLDSSVVCKLFRTEEGAEEIITIINIALDGDIHLKASDLVIYEIGNFLWKMNRRGFIFPPESIEYLYSLDIDFIHTGQEMAEKALKLSKDLGLTYYDATHIALARINQCPLVTSDREILAECEDSINLYEALALAQRRSYPNTNETIPSARSRSEL